MITKLIFKTINNCSICFLWLIFDKATVRITINNSIIQLIGDEN